MLTRLGFFCLYCVVIFSCQHPVKDSPGWELHGKLVIIEGSRIISFEDGTPFLWLGGTAWGMTEWMSREEVEYYLDDRKSKGMNVVQLCLFWGKRTDNPTVFTSNPENHYGHRAFYEKDKTPDPLRPAVVEGGSPENPNDYWDHVDFCLNALQERGMYAAVLPFWGRRYVNASHKGHSMPVFTLKNIFEYGRFLGERYQNAPHIIWVNGGDVSADDSGDFLDHYRLLAEGLAKGVTGEEVDWNEQSPIWDQLFITYHPAGKPLTNSSRWFHTDPWLDFNMIETHITRDSLVKSIKLDLLKKPLKPTVLAEGHYEGITNKHQADAIHVRRQAYQTFFAGAAGYTYGAGFDVEGNGPLFSVSNNWKPLLQMPGATQMRYLNSFLMDKSWWLWQMTPELIIEGRGEGELEKLAVSKSEEILIYFPDNSPCKIRLDQMLNAVSWFSSSDGETLSEMIQKDGVFKPPAGWVDGVLVIKLNKID